MGKRGNAVSVHWDDDNEKNKEIILVCCCEKSRSDDEAIPSIVADSCILHFFRGLLRRTEVLLAMTQINNAPTRSRHPLFLQPDNCRTVARSGNDLYHECRALASGVYFWSCIFDLEIPVVWNAFDFS